MSGIYNTILLNDIVKRLKIADVNMLEGVKFDSVENFTP